VVSRGSFSPTAGLAGYQLAVPGEHGLGSHEKAASALAREQATQGGEDDPGLRSKAGFPLLTMENVELVT
jgi:hypothetical protein